jgi:eukaryotic-like serine/threonine-protein kinase
MTPERWAAAQQLFEAALARPEADRPGFLAEATGGDGELAALVHGLLAADAEEQAGTPLAAVVRDAVAEVTAIPRAAPERLGPYRISRVLGEGGMGTVYLAERDDDEFLQQVAVKIVRGTLQPDRVRQFRTERQILAWLEHPNIARLFDGGTTSEGLPYLVMEYVEGAPIDRFCDEARLDIDARLRLFLPVCDAVSHAHRSLIVHRDIKPSNIIVTAGGVPKLLDFGIARLTLDGAPDQSGPAPPRMMTPFYASPEVVRGDQVTTAADVYALGVLLYELLTGTRPLRFATMTSEEVERVVCHVDPTPPSRTALEAGDHALPPEARAECRRTTPAALASRLGGDLDAIVARALHKDAATRYASVEALATDLRHHLARRPVTARPASWPYVAGRFVARHTWGVAVAAALLLLVTAAAVIFSVQAARLAEEGARTARERDTTQQVVQFLTRLFEVSNPDATPTGSNVTARELLDRGAERIDAELAGQPVVQARLLATMGTAFAALGAYERSATLFERALEQRRATLGSEHLDTAISMEDLAEAYRELARYDEAESLHRQALDLKRRIGASPVAVASSLNNLGLTLSERGAHADAEPLLREALDTWRRAEGDEGEHVAVGLNNLAAVVRQQGRLAEAAGLLESAVALRRRVGANTQPALSNVLGQLGQVYSQQGELAKAEPLLQEALAIRQRIYGDDHPDTATSRNNLASLLQDQGDLAAAEPLYRTALASVERRLGTAHPDYAAHLNNLATLLEERRRFADAEPLYRRSLEVRRLVYKTDEHAAVARAEHSLGRVLLALQRPREAEPHVRRALAVRERVLPAGHFEIGLGRALLGELLAASGRASEAEPLLTGALEHIKQAQGPRHPAVADCLLTLSAFYRRTDRPAQAERLAREAADIRSEKLPIRHWKRAAAGLELAQVLVRLGRRHEAAVVLGPATAALTQSLGAQDPRTVEAVTLQSTLSSS